MLKLKVGLGTPRTPPRGAAHLTPFFDARDYILQAQNATSVESRNRFLEKASRISVDTARPGQIFGWSALTGRGRRTVTATCSLPTKAAAIPAQSLLAMCAKDPALGYELMKRLVGIIANRLDNRNKRLIETWVEAFGISKVVP